MTESFETRRDFDPMDLVDYALNLAVEKHSEMSQEECVHMVQDFTRILSDWQPSIRQMKDTPSEAINLAIGCLTLAELFHLAFCSAYSFTEKRIEAREAIEKALGDL